MNRPNRHLLVLIIVLFLAVTFAAGCRDTSASQEIDHSFKLASLEAMPTEVQQAPVAVQQGYRFAVTNPEMLRKIPCYCGCGAMGHTSNYACYVADTDADGKVVFDTHALGCSICVDISLDTMRMLDQGKDISEIFTYVDSTYARFGPPTPLQQ